jgi:hypothetical protein
MDSGARQEEKIVRKIDVVESAPRRAAVSFSAFPRCELSNPISRWVAQRLIYETFARSQLELDAVTVVAVVLVVVVGMRGRKTEESARLFRSR